jgi:hypothetical protein
MKLAIYGALAALMLAAPTIASADYRYDRGARYDRGDRYYGGGRSYYGGYDRGYSRSSRSGFDFSIGFGNRGYHDYSYARFGYSSRPSYYRSHYYQRPVYVERPVYVAPPPVVYVEPVYSAPVYTTRSYYYRDSYYGGYARPRHYYYSTGSYYNCR